MQATNEVNQLRRKHFGQTVALAGLSFMVEPGSLTGIGQRLRAAGARS
jgi:hypothetical protein